MEKTPSLAVIYDGVLYARGSDMYNAWDSNFTEEHMHQLNKFVTERIDGRGPAEFVSESINDGSYNRVLRFKFRDGNDVALKFPKPGHSVAALATEKIANEAAWLEFFKTKTTISVPYVYSCGTELGGLLPALDLPYILMDWVSGESVREFLKEESSKKLRPFIFQQIASFYLELYRVPLEGIGSVVKDSTTEQWSMRRPLTIDMHQLALGVPNYPIDTWPDTKFTSTDSYFDFVAKQQQNQLWNLTNLNAPRVEKDEGHDYVQSDMPEDIARLRYEARYRLTQLFKDPKFCPPRDNRGPFHPFNPDFDIRDMKLDPETGVINGFFDFEFTNGMPASFACDPPLSLFRVLPAQCLDEGYFPWFLQQYEPVLEEFLSAMQKEEQKRGGGGFGQTPLSTLMRNSWITKRVWFNFALTHSDHADAIYWALLHKLHPGGVQELPPEVKIDMEKYAEQTKSQLAAYEDSLTNLQTVSVLE